MITFFRIRPFSAALILGVAMSGCSAKSEETNPDTSATLPKLSQAGLRQTLLTVSSSNQVHKFTVEVAQSGEEQARGLMFRTELAPDAGMIFPFTQDRMASFWMKNTVIPLDIIFIRRDGTIESIAANTTPYSLDPVRSGEPVATVFEIAGGRAAALSIKAGDSVKWDQ